MNPLPMVLSGNNNLIQLHELPPELLFDIASFLSFPDILRLGCTSTYFRRLFCSGDQTLWRRLYRRDLSTRRTPYNYQAAYLKYYRESRGKWKSLHQQIEIASRDGYEKMVQRLVTNGATAYNVVMVVAARGGHRDIVDLMLERGATTYNWAMAAAAGGGHRDIVELMLQWGATDYNGAMNLAARWGHRDIVDLMLQLGAGPHPSWVPSETDYNEAMAYADRGGHRDIVEYLQNYRRLHPN
jgi:hypothetical protein